MAWKLTLKLEETIGETSPPPNPEEAPKPMETVWKEELPTAREVLWRYTQMIFFLMDGNKSRSGKMLGINRKTLQRWLKKGIQELHMG